MEFFKYCLLKKSFPYQIRCLKCCKPFPPSNKSQCYFMVCPNCTKSFESFGSMMSFSGRAKKLKELKKKFFIRGIA